jgi:catechol 2,3-dioxygenase-like lactoylglutathione lyase family enzyme
MLRGGRLIRAPLNRSSESALLSTDLCRRGGRIWAVVLLLASLSAAGQSVAGEPLAGIAHVAFRVSDVGRSRSFYNSLGFEQAFAFADPGRPPVSYLKINDRQFIELYGPGEGSQSIGLMHLCYEASDIDRVQKEYEARGVAAPESRKARAGNLLFSIRAPDGQTIEYTEYMPGSLHSDDRGKHLGRSRISDHLVGVVVPTRDLTAARDFYLEKLGFLVDPRRNDSHELWLRLPGDSGEELGLEKADTKPKILFMVPNLSRAESDLRRRGLVANVQPFSVSVTDPDGVIIEFTSTAPGYAKRRLLGGAPTHGAT